MNNEKRTELCLHTNMGDGLNSIVEYLDDYASEYIRAIAVTDLNSVQAYQDAWKNKIFLSKRTRGLLQIKIIYGLQIFVLLKEIDVVKVTILAKNQTGLDNIYRLIGPTDVIEPETLKECREGLIIGCDSGEPFFAELQKAVKPDFICVTTEDSRESVNDALSIGLPVCAVGDVRYRHASDRHAYEYLMKKTKPEYDEDSYTSRHLQKPQALMDHFSYLGEDVARQIVIEEPNRIADMIEDLEPFPKEKAYPCFPRSDEKLRKACPDAAKQLYGEQLPDVIEKRLATELTNIFKNGFSTRYLIAQNICKAMRRTTIRGSAGNSLVAYLLGITDINPLPPHYICKKCRHLEWTPQVQSGYDLPNIPCPECGNTMCGDGHNLPETFFMGWEGHVEPHFPLCIPASQEADIISILETAIPDFRIVCGRRISTVGWRSNRMIKAYRNENDGDTYLNSYSEQLAALKTGMQTVPGKYMLVPKDTVIPLETEKGVMLTHMNDLDYENRFLFEDILPYTRLDMLLALEEKTGVYIDDIPMNDAKVYASLCTESIADDCSAGTDDKPHSFSQEKQRFYKLCELLQPKNFSEMVYLDGLFHSTGILDSKSDCFSYAGTAFLSRALATGEDIAFYLQKKGVDEETAYRLSYTLRKGRANWVHEELNAVLKKDVPKWFGEFCKNVRYLFPKAFCIDEMRLYVQLMWFKHYHPQAYWDTAAEFGEE